MSEHRELAIHLAAQCWCDKETENIEMDTVLATAFAKRLEVQMAARKEITKEAEALAEALEETIIEINLGYAFEGKTAREGLDRWRKYRSGE